MQPVFSLRNAALLAVVAIAALAACDTSAPKTASVRIEAVSTQILFDRTQTQLSPADKAKLDELMQSAPAYAVTFAGFAADDSNPRSSLRAAAVRDYLLRQGVDRSAIHFQPVNEAGVRDMLEVTLEYAVAVPPHPCPDFSKNALIDYNNTRFTNFGCAYYNDIVLQMQNPADFDSGRGHAPLTDSARESVFIQNYLNGTSSSSASSGSSSSSSSAAGSATSGR